MSTGLAFLTWCDAMALVRPLQHGMLLSFYPAPIRPHRGCPRRWGRGRSRAAAQRRARRRAIDAAIWRERTDPGHVITAVDHATKSVTFGRQA